MSIEEHKAEPTGSKGQDGAPAERPIINIMGEKVALGPTRRDLLPLYNRWMNDLKTRYLAGFVPKPQTLEEQTVWYDKPSDKEEAWFLVYEVATWRPVGFTGLNHIDLHNRTAEFGINIAEPECRGKGYGTEATRLVLDYAFTARGLHSVFLETSEYNIAGQRTYKKAGFKEIGRRRQCDMTGGRFWDVILMDCLASEFKSPVLASIFPGSEDEAKRQK